MRRRLMRHRVDNTYGRNPSPSPERISPKDLKKLSKDSSVAVLGKAGRTKTACERRHTTSFEKKTSPSRRRDFRCCSRPGEGGSPTRVSGGLHVFTHLHPKKSFCVTCRRLPSFRGLPSPLATEAARRAWFSTALLISSQLASSVAPCNIPLLPPLACCLRQGERASG